MAAVWELAAAVGPAASQTKDTFVFAAASRARPRIVVF
jgi:hypothetical protein